MPTHTYTRIHALLIPNFSHTEEEKNVEILPEIDRKKLIKVVVVRN